MQTFSFIILSVLMLILIAMAFFIGLLLKKKTPAVESQDLIDIGSIKTLLVSMENRLSQNERLASDIKNMVTTETQQQTRLHQVAENTKFGVDKLMAIYEEHKATDAANRKSLEKLEAIIAGTKSKGIAGENILKDILSNFPPEMIVKDFKTKGKTVEFGLVLANGKIVPIDSKWTSTDLLEELSNSQNEQEKQKIVEQIRKVVAKRVSEISQYIDSSITYPWAIAAVPDSVHSLCADEHLEAYRKDHVILISYSMTLPYLLTLYSMHLQYGFGIDIENLKNHLVDIKRNLIKMDDVLTNYIDKSYTMVKNAADSYRQLIGSIKNSVASIESSKIKEE